MGDLQAISKARRELEELYSGVPDESVNLTFQDLAEVRQQNNVTPTATATTTRINDNNNNIINEPSYNNPGKEEEVSPLTKLPSLDFNRGLKATHHHARSDHPIHYQLHGNHPSSHPHHDHHANVKMDHHQQHHHHHANPFNHRSDLQHHHHHHGSMAYDDVVSGMSTSMASMSGFSEINGRRRRPGIPHSNICTVCSTYIYVFRHRCLVCGRVYCRRCVGIGMGDLSEGRKCLECLGKRFSQRYIQRAGEVGCCCTGYPSRVKQEELKWAEKGPRRTGEDRYGRSRMVMSRSTSPNPRPPTATNSNSFVMMNSPYSPYYSPTNHPLPF